MMELSYLQYYLYEMNLIIIYLLTYIPKKIVNQLYLKYFYKIQLDYKVFYIILCIFNFILIITLLIFYKIYMFIGVNKLYFYQKIPLYYSYASITSIMCFCSFILQKTTIKNLIFLILSIVFVILGLSLGYRTTLVFIILSSCLSLSDKKTFFYNFKFLSCFALVCLFIFFTRICLLVVLNFLSFS